MADLDERLIKKDPKEEPDDTLKGLVFYKNKTFILVFKISLIIGLICSLLAGLVITNIRLANVESMLHFAQTDIQDMATEKAAIIANMAQLQKNNEQLKNQVNMLNLDASHGKLSTTLSLLDQQNKSVNKQLAVTRNGLISLSRMIKGSRVWRDDYRIQYDELFNANKRIQESIKTLRGIQDPKPSNNTPQFIEMDF